MAKKPPVIDMNFRVYGPAATKFLICPYPEPDKEMIIEKCAMGERGTGKTSAGIGSMTYHAVLQPEETRPIPWAIIRDTWTNLERTVLDSFLNPRPGSFEHMIRPALKVRDGGKVIEFPGFWKAYLFGVDSLKDMEKLRMQLGGLWVEEPAPAAVSEIGNGLDESIITIGKSSLRHPCSWQLCQVTMNYPDEDHWSWQRYGARKLPPNRFMFKIRKGENPAISDDYYKQMAEDFKDNPALLDRLVYGKPAYVIQGEAVTPEYNPDLHKADVDFDPIPGLQGIRFWDGYGNPCCEMMQITPRGYLHVFPDTCLGANIGVEELIETQVAPLMQGKYSVIPNWVDVGDPTMQTADQSSVTRSAARVIEDKLKTRFIGGPSDWPLRREAVKSALRRQIDGRRWIQISLSERWLSGALRGGWHYRKAPDGRILDDKPVKDKFSHPGDAFSHGIPYVLRMMRIGVIDSHQARRHQYVKPQTTWNLFA